MRTGFLNRYLAVVLLLSACLVGTAAATSLGIDWKQSPILADNVFSGVTITPDASKVFSGGSQLLVRNWEGDAHWGGQVGFIAAMSADGQYIVSSSGSTITLLNTSGSQIWSRNMDGQIKAVAVSKNGSFVISADDKGNYNSWATNGDFYGRNKTDIVKKMAIAPSGDLVVVTTDAGIRFFAPDLEPVWTDPRAGSLDDYIQIADDGSTIITAGGSRVSSHTRKGLLNWQAEVTKDTINDLACSEDCSLIVVGSQDNAVRGLDRYGKTHWTYSTGQWANAVATSRNGAVVAAGANDGTLFVFDHNGNLLTKRSFDSRIQPRTLAVSRDGSRIAVADQYYLYGLTLTGVSGSDADSDTIFVAASLNPVPKTTVTTVATLVPVVTGTVLETTTATPAATKQSPVGVWIVLPAVAGAFSLVKRYRQ
ncbi:WD40 repeat domain-containing protein [Methanoregula sp.]|uniref:WD40 repeat domain-containing protein n=1 Tax=Methanoregula sp. TaxID=2052170 RepID=UPI00236C92E3|nr:WD40 repeat domain-containing protein [Methanoregula sp.]MDD1685468.1 WD40 repeat domain-containing protein [Methanoregula sp.]